MMKMILRLWIAIVMLFLLASCTTDPNLVNYKSDANLTIQTYADTRIRDFSPDNWTIVCNIVIEGRKTIDVAKSKNDVDAVVNNTINAIDEVEMERKDRLNYKIRAEIINWSYLYFDLGQNNGVTREDVDSKWIDYYYGQYNGFHILHFRGWGFGLELETVIDNLSFKSKETLEILAVKEDCGMTLKELYEDGYITRSDLEEIYIINSN